MKDYYRILGVLDDAEDIIIRASYKALAQRYHPDKWKGDKEEANKKMQDINEAYETLSDANKRKTYDDEYFKYRAKNEPDENSDQSYEFESLDSEYDEAWKLGCEFFPKIIDEFKELKKISTVLANTYKNALISMQYFNKSTEIKYKYENEYLVRYYGSNEKNRVFAKNLLSEGFYQQAIEINKIIRLMGGSVTPEQIENLILKKYPEVEKYIENRKWNELIIRAKNKNISIDEAIYIMKRQMSINVEYERTRKQYIFAYKNSTFWLRHDEFLDFLSKHAGY